MKIFFQLTLVLLPFVIFPMQRTPAAKGNASVPKQKQMPDGPEKDQFDFKNSKKMFDQWYTGPLTPPSASMMPPAVVNYQPYVFVETNYRHFDKNRNAHDIDNLISLTTSQIFQDGDH